MLTGLMTNSIAIFLALVLAAFFAFDGLQQDWEMTQFIMRKLMGVIEYLAFWR